MKNNEIYTVQGNDHARMTIKLLTAIDLAEDIGNRKKKIGIKPNLAVQKAADSGATTHPEIIDGLLTYLHEEGFERITVMEGSWYGANTMKAAKVNGLLDVCQRHGVKFRDTKQDKGVRCGASGVSLEICESVHDIDYKINVPVLKGHCQTLVTCALKNMKGMIPDREKRRFHTMGLHRPIAHVNTVIRQDLILVDNICGDLDFEEGGNPVVMDRILAFKDPVLCDSFAAETMGYQPHDVEYIRMAEALGIGSTALSDAVVRDLSPERRGEAHPSISRRVRNLSRYIDAKDACSMCYGSLVYALDRLQDEGRLSALDGKKVSIGQGHRGKTGTLGVGKCTDCFNRNLSACPPKAVDIVEFLTEILIRE